MWFLYPSSRESGGPDLRAKARQRERDREAPRDPERQREPYPGGPLVAEPPTLDPPADSRIRMLGDERTQHLGRRADRRSDEQITRADREKAVLWMLGVFRVATRRSVVESCFDGHPFVANRVLADLESKKLIRKREVKHGKRGYQVYTLEGPGPRSAGPGTFASGSAREHGWSAAVLVRCRRQAAAPPRPSCLRCRLCGLQGCPQQGRPCRSGASRVGAAWPFGGGREWWSQRWRGGGRAQGAHGRGSRARSSGLGCRSAVTRRAGRA